MNSLKTYFLFVKPYWKLLLLTIIIGIVKFAIPLAFPLIVSYLIDDLFLNDEISVSNALKQLTYILIGSFFLFVVLRAPVEYYRQYFGQLATSRILYDLRSKLYEHIQKLSIKYYQNRKVGEIISRFVHDVEQTRNIVEVGMMNIWLDIITLMIVLSILVYIDPILTLAAIAIFPLYGLSVKIFYKRLKELTKDRSQALAEIQGYLHERIQGIPVIRSFTLEKYDTQQFGKKNSKYLDRAIKQTRWNAMTFAVINTITDIAPLIVIGYGGYQVIVGDLSPGDFTGFFIMLNYLYTPLRRLVNSSTVLTQAMASLDRVVEFMEEPYDLADQKKAVELPKAKGRIHFDQVSFSYLEEGEPVLKDIELAVEPGQTIALVGMSGGGKSSIVSLIPRFFDVQKGSITIDGYNVKDVTMKSLRQQIGMVLQDNILFSGTVYENISLGDPDANEQDIIEAAKLANAHQFIKDLPAGYDTEIGERGVKLSGGQKQRVAIARVFLKDPSILILDEATSALDLESESLIQKSLELLAKERTTIVVAHRLSTITHADQIVLLDQGQVKEKGTHQELMQLNGGYARLFNVQNLS